jgi:menaquinone-dependent protoporphyrinogen oxidase
MKTSTRREFIVDNALLAGVAMGAVAINMASPKVSEAFAEEPVFHESSCMAEKPVSPRILVAYASRCGSTGGVAETIGRTLCRRGASVDIQLIEKVEKPKQYDAAVIGSAVRSSAWLPEARKMVKRHRNDLSKIPVAYFVTCLTMCRPSPKTRFKAQSYLEPMIKEFPDIEPGDIGLFAGVLDYKKLSLITGLVMKSKMKDKGIAAGDYRDWKAIQKWSDNLFVDLWENRKKPVPAKSG